MYGLIALLGFATALLGVVIFFVLKELFLEIYIRKTTLSHFNYSLPLFKNKFIRTSYKGVLLFYKFDYINAIKTFEKALNFSDNSNETLITLKWISRVYKIIDKSGESINTLIKALQIEPNDLDIMNELLKLYLEKGDFEKAGFYCDSILKRNENDITAKLIRGIIFTRTGEYERAEPFFLEAVNLDKDNPISLRELTLNFALKGNYEQTEVYFNEFEKINPDREVVNNFEKRISYIKKMRVLYDDCK